MSGYNRATGFRRPCVGLLLALVFLLIVGSGVPAAANSKPRLLFSSRNLRFGLTTNSLSFTITARNGSFTVTVNAPSGKGASAYRITSGTFTLGSGAVQTVAVAFAPHSQGVFHAKIPVSYSLSGSTKANTNLVNVRLYGSARLRISPKRLNFRKETAFSTQSFTITARNGTFSGTVANPSGKGATAYNIVSGGGSFSVSPDFPWAVTVGFAPQRRGKFKAAVPVTFAVGTAAATKTVYVRLHGSAPTVIATPTPTPMPTPTPTPTPTAPGIHGQVENGLQNPINGATVTLYAAGPAGGSCTGASCYGAGASVLASTMSDSSGSFTFAFGSYTCPANNPQTYVVATGGDAGAGNNPAIGMMALTGPCNALTTSTFVTANELTTAAAQWALAQFIDSSGVDIGTSSTNATGLDNAASAAQANLVASSMASGGDSSNTGVPAQFLTSLSCPDPPDPQQAANCDALDRLDTLANILTACVDSGGPSSAQCARLFCGATPGATWRPRSDTCSTTPAPANTLEATHAIVTNPTANVVTLYGITPPPGLDTFRPALSSPAADFTLALDFAPSGADFFTPYGVAIDASGNVWLTNETGNSVTALNSSGGLIGNFLPPGADFNQPAGVVIDKTGNIWVTNESGNSVTVLNSSGGLIGNFTPPGANFGTPTRMAIDKTGNVWVANHQGNSVTELNSSGGLIGNFTPAGANFDEPSGVAIDTSGNVWVVNHSDSSVTVLGSDGSLVDYFYNNNPAGADFYYPYRLAIDASGNVWIANFNNTATNPGSVTALTSKGGLFGRGNFNNSNTAGANFYEPYGIAIDAGGNVWMANLGNNSVTELKSTGGLAGNFAPAGANFNEPFVVAIDASGNVWVANRQGNSVSELIGQARPVLTPLCQCLSQTPAAAVCLP
jgi:streptogramin lyase